MKKGKIIIGIIFYLKLLSYKILGDDISIAKTPYHKMFGKRKRVSGRKLPSEGTANGNLVPETHLDFLNILW